MAMNADHDPAGDPVLDRAARALREITDDGWVRARPELLTRLTHALRPSEPVRGRHDLGEFTVRAEVVVARVGAALDRLPGVRALRIGCVIDPDGYLHELSIAVSVEFGTVIPVTARSVRVAAARAASETLGINVRTAQISVDLHISDVYRA